MFNAIAGFVVGLATILGSLLGIQQATIEKDAALGASQTISSLTAKTTLQGDDTMVIVDNSGTPTTKKITITNATTSMKGYWDSIYSPIFSTSAGLRTLLSDETGSGGAAVFATGPTISGAQLTGSPTITTPSFDVAGTDATGDIYYNGGSGVFTRLAAGSANEFLRISGGLPDWDNTAILTNPQTASSTFTATTTIDASNINNKALILNSLAYSWPSSRGGQKGQFLTDNGTGALTFASTTGMFWSTTSPAIYTGTPLDIFSLTIPANTLALGRALHGRLFASWATGATTVKELELNFGGTECVTDAAGAGVASAVTYVGHIDFTIVGTASSAQECFLSFYGNATGGDFDGTVSSAYLVDEGTATIDSTAQQTLILNVLQNSSEALTITGGYIEWIN